MASYNRVIMMGNLTRDPELRQLSSGQSVCRLGIASNRQFKNRQTGMMVQEVCFVDVDVWGAQAESCNQYLQKGRGVLIEGRLKLDSWVDNDGQRRSKHSIVADRVTFMPSQSTADVGASDTDFDFGASSSKSSAGRSNPQRPVAEPAVSRRATAEPVKEEPKATTEASATGSPVPGSPVPGSPATSAAATSAPAAEAKAQQESASTSSGEVNFKDQEPFEDDLPF